MNLLIFDNLIDIKIQAQFIKDWVKPFKNLAMHRNLCMLGLQFLAFIFTVDVFSYMKMMKAYFFLRILNVPICSAVPITCDCNL